MRLSRQQYLVQNKPENVENCNYLGIMIRNDARYIREITTRIAMKEKQH
jgi:hypothetical protein